MGSCCPHLVFFSSLFKLFWKHPMIIPKDSFVTKVIVKPVKVMIKIKHHTQCESRPPIVLRTLETQRQGIRAVYLTTWVKQTSATSPECWAHWLSVKTSSYNPSSGPASLQHWGIMGHSVTHHVDLIFPSATYRPCMGSSQNFTSCFF